MEFIEITDEEASNLPAGIVNIAGILEYLTLQTTRLSTVITLADTIAQGILGNFI